MVRFEFERGADDPLPHSSVMPPPAAVPPPIPAPIRKPRKKTQAFGIPKTAALKEKIDRNAKHSPLLRLPTEVRARIWKHLLGNRLLHIKWVCKLHPDEDDCHCIRRCCGTFCCIVPHSEEELFQRSKIPLQKLITKDEAIHGPWLNSIAEMPLEGDTTKRREARAKHLNKPPHYQCRQFIDLIRTNKPNMLAGSPLITYLNGDFILPLHILEVCRQVYIEAHPILWSTNTLSFCATRDLARFMAERTTVEKAAITRLHLDSLESAQGHSWQWDRRVFTTGFINALSGLKVLHLCLTDEESSWDFNFLAAKTDRIDAWREQLMDTEVRKCYTDFKCLQLRDVTVLMGDSKEGVGQRENWRRAERAKYAETVRQAILDPDGARTLAQDRAIAREAMEAANVEYQRGKLPCDRASTEEECDRLRLMAKQTFQAKHSKVNKSEGKKSKPTKASTNSRACEYEHVCLVCLNQLDRTRDEARSCPRPGVCDEGHFEVLLNNTRAAPQSKLFAVHGDETISTILKRYLSISHNNKKVFWELHFDGIKLDSDATVKELGLQSKDKIDMTAHNIKKQATSDAVESTTGTLSMAGQSD